jgi:hypothetical protein
MADAPNTPTTLSGFFKERYADALENAKPKGLHLRNDISFIPARQQPGNTFHQPVSLSHEHGFSYATSGTDAFTLGDAVASNVRDAQVLGTQLLLKTQVGYETAARASGNNRAFGRAFDIIVENMFDSHAKRTEVESWHGREAMGVVAAINDTTKVMTIEATHYAPGIWAGAENAVVEVFSTTAATATQRNGPDFTITQVDINNKTVTISETTSNIAVGDFVYWNGARTGTAHNVFQGVHSLLTTSGTVLNISSATYSLWQPTSHSISSTAAGNMTFNEVQKAVAKAVGKGLDRDVVLYLNPTIWVDLLNDEAALRTNGPRGAPMFDVGAEGLTFFSQNGTIMIRSSIYVKEGFAYLMAPSMWSRVGATDITFRLPDRGDEFFLHNASTASYELRSYCNWAMFTRALAKAVIMDTIIAGA